MVTMPEEAIYSKPFQATCRASLQPRVAPYLTQYLTVEWMGAEGEYLTSGGAVTIEKQQTSSTAATKDLVFNPLNMTHGGNYVCEAKVVLPDSAGSFNTTHQYHLNVISEVVRVFRTLNLLIFSQTELLFNLSLAWLFTVQSGMKTG